MGVLPGDWDEPPVGGGGLLLLLLLLAPLELWPLLPASCVSSVDMRSLQGEYGGGRGEA